MPCEAIAVRFRATASGWPTRIHEVLKRHVRRRRIGRRAWRRTGRAAGLAKECSGYQAGRGAAGDGE
jgi:hypothetical protein